MGVCLKSLANVRTSLLSLHKRFAKKFLVPFDVQYLKSNLQQALNRTHILNAAPSSMQFQDRVQ
jgi:hypothetical protein